MDKPLISVIVPVYNVEPYLDRCVQSIVDQTYTNLEIILVDDGSPDNCPALCDAWAEKDSRIRVIHKENGGLSDARNAGMAIATGEYIAFVDSDDWISTNMYHILYDAIIEHNSEIAECTYLITSGNVQTTVTIPSGIVYNTLDAMSAHVNGLAAYQVVWNKLYHHKIVSVPFEFGRKHEDEFWTYQIIANCNQLVHIAAPLYYYYQRPDSIMAQNYSLTRLGAIEAHAQRLDYITKNFPALSSTTRITFLFSCLYHGQLTLKHLFGTDRTRALEFLIRTTKAHPIRLTDCRGHRLTHKLWLLMASHAFTLTCRLRNALGIGV